VENKYNFYLAVLLRRLKSELGISAADVAHIIDCDEAVLSRRKKHNSIRVKDLSPLAEYIGISVGELVNAGVLDIEFSPEIDMTSKFYREKVSKSLD